MAGQLSEGTSAAPKAIAEGGLSLGEVQLRQQIATLQEQLDDLKLNLLPNHPMVLALQTKIDRLSAMAGDGVGLPGQPPIDPVKRFGENYLAAAEQRYEIAKFKEDELQKTFGTSLEEQKRIAVESNNKAATYAMMDADFRRTQNLCDTLQTRINELHVTEDAGVMNVTILEYAKPSYIASKPQKARTMSIALMLGITLGFGLAFISAWMDQRLRSAEEIQSALGQQVLGVVGSIAGKLTPTQRGQKVHLEPASEVAESYRTIRTAIYFGVPDSKTKTLLVTSPQPGDGKTTSASNMAIAMAQAGQRTLILDADCRRPTQHKIFQIEPGPGISGVLTGKAALADAIKHTGVNRLDLLPCGPIPKNPAEILNSQAFADVLVELCKTYDHIVIDSPPVMPVTDARILGAMCDITVLVLRAEKSTRKTAVFACEVLQSVGSNILGVVVNDVPRRRGRYGSYYYGYYQYGYGYYGRREDEKAPSADRPLALENSNGNGSNGHGGAHDNGSSNGNGDSNGNHGTGTEHRALT